MARITQRSANTGGTSNAQSNRLRARLLIGIAIISVLLLTGVFLFYTTEQFLIRDGRFTLAESEGGDNSSIHVRGVTYASARAIESVFSEDTGRSVYLLPLEARRDTLRSIDWVRDASVARVWPNQLFVHVKERRPVAFVAQPYTRYALIDEDGVILRPVTARFHLPVLKGIRATDSIQARREQVRRMVRLLGQLGDSSENISEVDTSDRENLKVTIPGDGRMMTLWLGDRNLTARYLSFGKHFAEIKEKSPHGNLVDLRIDGKITVIDQN